MRTRLLALAAAVALLAACTGRGRPGPSADPDAAGRQARARLAVLAQITANGAYDATYRFVQQPSGTAGEIRIRQQPPQYRIDVVTKDTASFFSLRTGTVSCSRTAKKKTCFLVARPGEEVPPLFDPGVQRLFRDAVSDLATNPNDYVVTPLPVTTPTATPSPALPPPGECFSVERSSVATVPDARLGFENGTYCFAEAGYATRIEVESGSLTLLRVGPDPGPPAFKPITAVQRLPDLTASPTPKK